MVFRTLRGHELLEVFAEFETQVLCAFPGRGPRVFIKDLKRSERTEGPL